MKTFCKSIEEHAMEITNFETEKMIPLTDEGSKSYERQKICYICRKKLKEKMMMIKNIVKLEIIERLLSLYR